MKRYFFNNPVFRIVAPAVYGVLLYMLILLINNNVARVTGLFATEELYVVIVLTYICFESLRAGIMLAARYPRTPLRIALQVLVTWLLSLVLVLGALLAYFHYVVGFSISATQLTLFAAIYTVTALLYNAMYLSHDFLHRENSLKLNAEKQQRTVLEAEMMEYRNDINPDLLYESLENLIAIMYKDVEKAEDYVDSLAFSYRYVLTNRGNEMVSIRQELEACRNIVRLLNERYGGRLILDPGITEQESGGMLIPGSLPVIVEYLVRSSIIDLREGFVIRLYMEEEYLTIETRLNERLIVHGPSEQAFARLQRSYSLYTELPLIRVKAYDQNYVKLPVLRVGEEIEDAQ